MGLGLGSGLGLGLGLSHEGAHPAVGTEAVREVRVGGDRDENPTGRPG